MKIVQAALTLLLLAMAYLQLNDPDPLLWVCLYLAIAMTTLARMFERKVTFLFDFSCGLAVAGLLISLPGFFIFLTQGDVIDLGAAMTPEKPYIEFAREFLGTLIGVVCLAANWQWHRSTSRL